MLLGRTAQRTGCSDPLRKFSQLFHDIPSAMPDHAVRVLVGTKPASTWGQGTRREPDCKPESQYKPLPAGRGSSSVSNVAQVSPGISMSFELRIRETGRSPADANACIRASAKKKNGRGQDV
jgi:hypothetical protein